MKPTPEQLEAVRSAIEDASGSADDSDPEWGNWTTDARAAWAVIVPMVLEAAATACDDYFRHDGPLPSDAPGEYIRALK